MTTVEEATCSSLGPRTVFDGESGLLSCTEKLLQFYCSGRVSSTANETWRCTLHSCRSFKTRETLGAGRGIFSEPISTANAISKMQCFGQLEPFRASAKSHLTL